MYVLTPFFNDIINVISKPESIIVFGDVFMNLGLMLEGFFILRSKGLQKIEVIIYCCFVITSISYTLVGHKTHHTSQFFLNLGAFCVQLSVLSVLFYRAFVQKKQLFFSNFYQNKKRIIMHRVMRKKS